MRARPDRLSGSRASLAALALAAAAVSAEAQPMGTRPATVSFPSAKEYFEPFIADPTELSYGGRYVLLVGGDRLGEIMIGDTAGIVRWDWGGRGCR